MYRHFPTRIYSYPTCKQCLHEAREHVQDYCCSNSIYYGSCNAKLCSCRWYTPYITFISEKTRGSQTIDYLFYELGINVIPVNTKKRSYDSLLNTWKELPIPDLTFERWKKMGLFKKGRNRLNYGIIIGKIHRGTNKGETIGDMAVEYDIDKGTIFVPISIYPKSEYELFSWMYEPQVVDEPHDSQLGDPSSPIDI